MKQLSFLSIFALLLLASSCGKHDPPTPPKPVDSTILYLHLHTNLDTNEVEAYSTVYQLQNGRKISASVTEMYLSDFQLIKSDGSTYDIPGLVVLKTQEVETYLVATIPVGNYKSIRFHAGLDDQTNTLNPSANPALDHQEMWFNATAQPGGYVYLYFAGRIDTTTNANGTTAQMQIFDYKLGTSAAYKEVTMPDHSPMYDFEKDIVQYIHITIDYSKLLNGVQLNDNANLKITTAAGSATTLGTNIINNIPSMFEYEE